MGEDYVIRGPLLGQADVCAPILRALPQWFGIEQATLQYIQDIETLPTLTAWVGERAVGFVSFKQHNAYSAEVHVMGCRVQAWRPAQRNIARHIRSAIGGLSVFGQRRRHSFLHDQRNLAIRQGSFEKGHIIDATVEPVVVLPDVPANPEVPVRRDRPGWRGGVGPGLPAVDGDLLGITASIQNRQTLT